MRKIYLTERQIQRLCENFTAYNPNEYASDEAPSCPNNTVVTTGERTDPDDADIEGTPITDRIAKERTPNWWWWRGIFGRGNFGGHPGWIYESNQDLEGKDINLGKNTNELIRNTADSLNGSSKLFNNMSSDKNMPYGTAMVRKTRLGQKKEAEGLTDAENAVLKQLEHDTKRAQDTIASQKKRRFDNGEKNVYQKEGGTKQSGNGKGHSSKSPFKITYENN